jgi:hypothetical protein
MSDTDQQYDSVTHLSDAELDMEIKFADAFGPDIDPRAPGWIAHLAAEKARREANDGRA